MYKSSSNSQLSKRFKEIVEVNDRLNQLNNIELQELRNYLSRRYQDLIKMVLQKAPQPLNTKDEVYKKVLLSTLDIDNHNAPFIKHFILKIDKQKAKRYLDKFDANVFLNPESQFFFNYLFEHWLSKETTRNALYFVFRKFWVNNQDYEYRRFDNYLIVCDFKTFANNWNKNYRYLCDSKTLGFKNFKLKTFVDLSLSRSDFWQTKINALERNFINSNKESPKNP